MQAYANYRLKAPLHLLFAIPVIEPEIAKILLKESNISMHKQPHFSSPVDNDAHDASLPGLIF